MDVIPIIARALSLVQFKSDVSCALGRDERRRWMDDIVHVFSLDLLGFQAASVQLGSVLASLLACRSSPQQSTRLLRIDSIGTR